MGRMMPNRVKDRGNKVGPCTFAFCKHVTLEFTYMKMRSKSGGALKVLYDNRDRWITSRGLGELIYKPYRRAITNSMNRASAYISPMLDKDVDFVDQRLGDKGQPEYRINKKGIAAIEEYLKIGGTFPVFLPDDSNFADDLPQMAKAEAWEVELAAG